MTAEETRTFNAVCDEMLGMLRQIRGDLAEIKASMDRTQRRLEQELHTDRHEALTASRLDQMAGVLFAIADKLGVEYRQ